MKKIDNFIDYFSQINLHHYQNYSIMSNYYRIFQFTILE